MLIRECFQMFCLATADYRRERLLSLCSILGLAAVLAPLLVLYGVKFGVVTTMVSRMRSDPLTLELSPVSSGHFTQDFFTSLRQEPGVAFVLPRTRSIAATMQLSNTAGDGTRRTVVCSMEPTAAGDPLLARYSILLVECRRNALFTSSFGIPHPLSRILIKEIPPSLISTVTDVEPASMAFSTSSFTIEAGLSITSPAAILSIVIWSNT